MSKLVEITNDGWTAAKGRDLMRLQVETWKYLGKYWHKKYKAIKFTRRGGKKYKYAPRSGDPGGGTRFKNSYQWAKLNKVAFFSKESGAGFDEKVPLPIGEVKPNVWAGRSRASAMAQNQVKATSKKVGFGRLWIIMNTPLLHRSRRTNNIRPHLEVTRITADEISDMEARGTKFFDRRLRQVRRNKTKVK